MFKLTPSASTCQGCYPFQTLIVINFLVIYQWWFCLICIDHGKRVPENHWSFTGFGGKCPTDEREGVRIWGGSGRQRKHPEGNKTQVTT